MPRKPKRYYIITKYYLNPDMYILKTGITVYNKHGKREWRTRNIFGPTSLKKMLIDHGRKLAESHDTRLLAGINNNQPYKRSDIKKEVANYELQ